MRIKRIISAATALTTLFFLLPQTALAASITDNNVGVISYIKSGNFAVIADIDFTAENAYLPSEIDGSPLAGIESLSGGQTVKSITLPSTVTSITDGVFSGQTALSSIFVSEDNKFYSSENGVLFNKDKTRLLCFPPAAGKEAYAVPAGVKTVAPSSFKNCANLKSLFIGNNIEEISCDFSSCAALEDIFYFGTQAEWSAVVKAIDKLPAVHLVSPSSFAAADSLTSSVIYGNTPFLPPYAKASADDGSEFSVPLEWDLSAVNGAGQYTIKGRACGCDIYEAQLSVLPCTEASDEVLRYFGCQNTAYQAHKFRNTYSGKLHFEFDLDLINAVDGIVAFSSGTAVYGSEAIGIRPNSVMSARNGSSWVDFYTSVPGETYRFDIETDTYAHTWSAVMTTPAGAKITFADNYSYRSDQDSLSYILLTRNTSTFDYVDDVYLRNLKISICDSYVPVSGIDMPSALEIKEGTNAKIDISVLPSNAVNQNFTCTSSDESVAVYDNGVISALSEGTAVLTATTSDGGFSKSCLVTVTKNTSLSYGLIAYYPFNEYIPEGDTSCTVTDASGNGNDASIASVYAPLNVSNGTAHFPGNLSYSPDKLGSALRLPAAINRGVTDFTYSAWVKADSSYVHNSKLVRLFDFGNIASNNPRNSIFMRYTPSSGELYFCDRLPNKYYSQVCADLPFTDKWGLLTLTYEYNGGSGCYETTTYINGVKQDALSASDVFTRSLTDLGELDDASNGLFIGRTVWGATGQYISDNPDFCGDMDEIRLYNRALSAEEVLLIYEEHKPSELTNQTDIKVITQADGTVVSESTVSADINSSYTYTAAVLAEFGGDVYLLDEGSSTLCIENVRGEGDAVILNYVKAAFAYDKPQFLTCTDAAPSLPETVVFTVNGEKMELEVNWDSACFAEKGEYTVSGVIAGTNVGVCSEGRVFPSYNGSVGGDLTINYYAGSSLRRSETVEQAYGTEFTLSPEVTEALGVMYTFERAEGAVSAINESIVLDELYQTIDLYYTLKNTLEGSVSASVREASLDGTSQTLSAEAEVFNLTDRDETAHLIVADYDRKGRSSIVYENEIFLPRKTEAIKTISVKLSYDKGQYNNLEVLLWTDSLMPVTDIVSVNALDVNPYLSEDVYAMMPTYDSAVSAMRRANDYWQSYQSYDNWYGGTHPAFWDKAAYHTGNIEYFKLTGDTSCLQYTVNWANYNNWKGNNSAADPSTWTWGYNQEQGSTAVLFGDWQICFQTYIDLYSFNKDGTLSIEGANVDRVFEVMDYQISKDEDDFWWWADALYMVMPVMTKMYKLTGDEIYLDKLYEWFKYAKELMYDGPGGIPSDETGYTTSASLKSGAQYSNPEDYKYLFYRDAGYVYPLNPNPGHETEKNFWSRGNGWVFAALAKVLSDMPVTYAHYDEFYNTYTQMASAIISCQQTDENGYGFWTQSMLQDYPKGSNGNDEGYETSGTAFFTYGLFWGINNSVLDEETYLEPAVRAWGYLENAALRSDGMVGYVQPIGSNATSATPRTQTANFGVGAFLLASCEAARWAK